MRIKKGFTLAEILIVLMVIGVIATMTVPSLMKGVNEAQFKTAFKKAFNNVTNVAAVEKVSGQLPVTSTTTAAYNFFSALNNSLSVKEYYGTSTTLSTDASEAIAATDSGWYTGVTLNSAFYGTSGKNGSGTTISTSAFSPWIVTDDGLAYSVGLPSSTQTCGNKSEINAQSSLSATANNACIVVAVDVNGLTKGPNKLESQVTAGVSSSAKMTQLEGDRYYIYVGNDGVAAGNKAITVSGRLMSDLR